MEVEFNNYIGRSSEYMAIGTLHELSHLRIRYLIF